MLGQPLKGHDFVTSVALSADGKTLASGGTDGTVRLWDVATRSTLGQPLKGHAGVASVAFSADGKTLASGGEEGTVRLWDVAARRALGQPLKGHDGVTSVAFRANGKTLASGGEEGDEGTVRLWDVATRRALGQPLTGHASWTAWRSAPTARRSPPAAITGAYACGIRSYGVTAGALSKTGCAQASGAASHQLSGRRSCPKSPTARPARAPERERRSHRVPLRRPASSRRSDDLLECERTPPADETAPGYQGHPFV